MSWLPKLLVFGLSCLCSLGQAESGPTTKLDTDQVIQPLLRRLFLEPISQEDVYRASMELDQLAADGLGVEIIQQSLLLGARNPNPATGLSTGVMMLHLRLGGDVIIEAAAPLLDSDEQALREHARSVLCGLAEAPVGVDDDELVEYFKTRSRESTETLAAMLLRHFPGRALLILDRVFGNPEEDKRLQWANHLVSTAIWRSENGFLEASDVQRASEQLEKLSSTPEWWARTYVAEIISRHSFLRTQQLWDRLQADSNPRVREALRDALSLPVRTK